MRLFSNNNDNQLIIRDAVVAGQFYSDDSATLKKDITHYLKKELPYKKFAPMIISPHAGYIFSGDIAGFGFASLNPTVRTVFIIGPSHHIHFSGISIANVSGYKTPLGTVSLNNNIINKLRQNKMVHSLPNVHKQEHSIEVQIPFLQMRLNKFTIVPIVTGKIDNPAIIAELIYPYIDEKSAVIISSDFSHYKYHDDAKQIDSLSIETILSKKTIGFIDGCGETPIRVAMHLANKMKLVPKLLNARNSYETAPSYSTSDRVVGYVSIIYISKTDINVTPEAKSEREPLNSDKKFMLDLAHKALLAAVYRDVCSFPKTTPNYTNQMQGCFVTLKKHGALRGCIGYIEGIKPLWQAIMDNTKNAAMNDPRFTVVHPTELDDITIEISVLTPPKNYRYLSTSQLLLGITAGVDGVILSKGNYRSTFLPQVWEQLPDKVTFLEHLARKAGLEKDEWKDAQYRIYQATYFTDNR